MVVRGAAWSRPSRASQIAQLIAEDFFGDMLDLATRDMSQEALALTGLGEGRTWSGMPEVEAVRAMRPSGTAQAAGPDSGRLYSVRTSKRIRSLGADDRVVRLFLTLISAMDRARDATQLWRAGMSLYEEGPETFDPQLVAGLEFDTLLGILKSSGVSRRHRPDTRAWLRIADSLSAGPPSPVTRLIDAGRGDARELLRDLKTRDENGRLSPIIMQIPA